MAIDYGTIIDAAARSDSVNSSGLPIDMEKQTALLDPNSYVFEAITRQVGKKKETNQMKHEYRERRCSRRSPVRLARRKKPTR